jgi:hypothetical protein
MSQAVLKLFEFLVFPQLGSSAQSWRNLPQVSNQSEIIASLQGAPTKAPKPVAVLRAGRGSVVIMPRLTVPDSIEVVQSSDPIEEWLGSQLAVMTVAIGEGLSATKCWSRVDIPEGVSKLKAKDNDWWQGFRAKYGAMQNGNPK